METRVRERVSLVTYCLVWRDWSRAFSWTVRSLGTTNHQALSPKLSDVLVEAHLTENRYNYYLYIEGPWRLDGSAQEDSIDATSQALTYRYIPAEVVYEQKQHGIGPTLQKGSHAGVELAPERCVESYPVCRDPQKIDSSNAYDNPCP